MDTEQLFYTQNGYDRADTGPLTTAMEDYLEMICRLTRTGGYTRISALARELHVQPSSASKMAALLRSGGYLTNERYGCLRLTEKGLPLFFRTCPRDDEQGRVASKVIAAKGFKKVAILHDNSSYAKGLAEEAQKGLKDAGVPVVFYDALTPSERDYTAILTKLKAADPDLIFFTGYYPEAGMLLRQKKEMHWDVPMMGGDAANNTDLVKIAGKDAAKGYFFISPPSAHDFDTPEAKDFFSRYKAQYNSLPSSVWSVLAGDAFKVIVAALQAGTDANPEAVAKYLKKDLKEYPGLTGKLGFNEKGDRIGDLYKVYEVDGNGGFVLQK